MAGDIGSLNYGDRVTFDSINGVAGIEWPVGTPQLPSDVIADVITICAARNINKIHVTGTLTIGAGIAQDLVGHNSILTGQTAGAAYVREFSGYLEIDAMVGGTLDIYAHGAEIQINADCAAGTINIYGVANVTVIAGATVTVNDYTVPYQIDRLQGGAETLESLDDELDAFLDLGGGDSETLAMTGAVQELFKEEAGTSIRLFAGMHIDWTGLNAGGGENTTIIVERKYGALWRKIYEETFLAAAVPDPAVTPVPRDINTQCVPTPIYYKQGIRVTAQQALVGGGWNTLTWDQITGARGA